MATFQDTLDYLNVIDYILGEATNKELQDFLDFGRDDFVYRLIDEFGGIGLSESWYQNRVTLDAFFQALERNIREVMGE